MMVVKMSVTTTAPDEIIPLSYLDECNHDRLLRHLQRLVKVFISLLQPIIPIASITRHCTSYYIPMRFELT